MLWYPGQLKRSVVCCSFHRFRGGMLDICRLFYYFFKILLNSKATCTVNQCRSGRKKKKTCDEKCSIFQAVGYTRRGPDRSQASKHSNDLDASSTQSTTITGTPERQTNRGLFSTHKLRLVLGPRHLDHSWNRHPLVVGRGKDVGSRRAIRVSELLDAPAGSLEHKVGDFLVRQLPLSGMTAKVDVGGLEDGTAGAFVQGVLLAPAIVVEEETGKEHVHVHRAVAVGVASDSGVPARGSDQLVVSGEEELLEFGARDHLLEMISELRLRDRLVVEGLGERVEELRSEGSQLARVDGASSCGGDETGEGQEEERNDTEGRHDESMWVVEKDADGESQAEDVRWRGTVGVNTLSQLIM
ncbi:hypothetical protein FN846DRAFT_974407, partial [Sphaerosporella brunnea]